MTEKMFSPDEYRGLEGRLDEDILNMYKKSVTCCFTGHRPEKMRLESEEALFSLERRLFAEVKAAVRDGFWYFITGGSLGFDTMAAEAVLCLKEKNADVFLEIAVPCLNQSGRWAEADRNKYAEILERADKVFHVTNSDYTEKCMLLRNKYMVDRSSLVICAYNGERGGTGSTVAYAQKSGIEVINLLEE